MALVLLHSQWDIASLIDWDKSGMFITSIMIDSVICYRGSTKIKELEFFEKFGFIC